MKLTRIRTYLLSVICYAAVSACTTDNNQTPTPMGGPLSGTVQLWDDKVNQLVDNSGVTVAVDDLTNVTATTDVTGKYSFANLPYGLHNFTFSKAGYGSHRLFEVSHAQSTNGTTLSVIPFGRLSTTTVTSLSVSGTTFMGGPGVSLLYSVSPTPTPTNRGYVRYFLSTDQAVSNTNYKYTSLVLSVLNNDVTGGFTKDDLTKAGFSSGQKVYVRLYGESVQSNSYTDPNVGKVVFPNINPTSPPAVNFVMP